MPMKDSKMKSIELSKEIIRMFSDRLREHSRETGTVMNYQQCLSSLLEALPDDKTLTEYRLDQWVEAMQREGYSVSTINKQISIVNSFCVTATGEICRLNGCLRRL